METFLAIIFIVFGILQIILFFKVWGMTNDVKNISKKIDTPVNLKSIQIEYMKGNIEKAKSLLEESLYNRILDIHYSQDIAPEYERQVKSIIQSYQNLYSKLKMDMPDVNKYIDRKNLPI